MANRDQQVRLFRRVADQRLTTAEFLLQHGFNTDAVYLAGYAVECSLKSIILRGTSHNRFKDMRERLTEVGAKGHDFEYLKGILKEQRRGRHRSDRERLGALTEHLQMVSSWSTDLRYEVGALEEAEAERFFNAAKAIRDICARS